MTPRETILSALRRQQDELIPFELSGFNRQAWARFQAATGSSDPAAYFGCPSRLGWIGLARTMLDPYPRFMPYHRLDGRLQYSPGPDPQHGQFYLNDYGTAFVTGSDPAYDHFTPPAAMVEADSVAAFENYPMPDYDADYRCRHLEESARRVKARGLAVVAGMEMTIFEPAWQIRGFEQLLTDFVERPELIECLLDRITAGSIVRARRFAQAGADIIRTGDDVGIQDRMMISPATWRRFLKPRLAKVFAAAKQAKPDVLIQYHSDGHIEPIIDDLMDIGLDVLNPVQPECMDLARLQQRFGSRLSFWGTIGLQRALSFGTPAEVQAEVAASIRDAGAGGGLVLSPTHVLAPEVPLANITAMVQAAMTRSG